MKSNYKTIGQYIQVVDIRNKEDKKDNLLGVSVSKVFMKSIANTVGTDFTTYRVVKKNQFTYIPDTSRRGDKIGIALLEHEEEGLVSQAYTVFEIIDHESLLPQYLMMWFRRPEFDRYARYISHGSVREIFSWEDMCNVALPIPSIEKQKEIVKEYNTIIDRIKLNNQLIQKLEETAQAVYKQWFVDFEFPNTEGVPYKSNGGEMVESELGEIPQGWKVGTISSLSNITSSKRIFESEYTDKGIPFYRGKEISLKKLGEPINDIIYITDERYNEIKSVFGKPKEGDILMTAVGTIGVSYLVQNEEFYFKDGNVIWFKDFNRIGDNYFLYDFMQTEKFTSLINEITIGSTQSAITIKSFGEQKIVIPCEDILKKYLVISVTINQKINHSKLLNIKLYSLKDLLLSKLATMKN